MPMAGIPFHAVDNYVTKLLDAGKKVAFCDQVEAPRPGKLVKRDRSYSMNIFMGGWSGWAFWGDQQWQVYHKLEDIGNPSERFVLLDMRPNSINAGNYRVDMSGWPDKPNLHRFWQDYPGVYHNDATMFSFADGHCDKRRWLDDRTKNPPEDGAGNLSLIHI